MNDGLGFLVKLGLRKVKVETADDRSKADGRQTDKQTDLETNE